MIKFSSGPTFKAYILYKSKSMIIKIILSTYPIYHWRTTKMKYEDLLIYWINIFYFIYKHGLSTNNIY